jgi:hypothetical protein
LPISTTPQGQPRLRLWILLVLSVVAGLLAVGFAFAFITTPQRQPGALAVGQVAGTVISVAFLVLFARTAAELEHRLRRPRPEAQELDAAHTARADARSSQLVFRRHRHRFSPGVMASFCAFTTITAIAVTGMAIDSQSLDSRSAFVQSQGMRMTGIVEAVHNHQYCQAIAGGAGRSACIPRADIQVKLPVPIHGVPTTVAYYPYLSFLRRGQRVSVLVDPRQPGYAELPGHRYRGAGGWLIFAVIAALLALLALAEARALAHVLAVRGRHAVASRA